MLTSKKLEIAAVCLLTMLTAGAYALSKKQDVNWDQLNYHIYSIYALLHDRARLDVIPSQQQTWTNPLGNALQYLLVMNLPPRIVTVLLAALASTSVILNYFLAKRMLNENDGASREFRLVVCTIAAVGAFFSPMFLSEVGTTFNDYIGGAIILLALWFLLRRRFSPRAYLVAGALLGVAAGIKLTNAYFVIGWVAAVVAAEKSRALRPLALSGAGAVAAYVPIGGIWNFYVYKLFGNPLFPLYNHIFKSDAYAHSLMLDERFKPKSIATALQYFPKWVLGEHTTTEILFKDARFMIALLLLALAFPRVIELIFARRDRDAALIFTPKCSLFVLVFAVVSFVAWLAIFGIERYALLLEQLTPLVILVLLSLLCGGRRVFVQAAVMSLVLVLATTQPPNWGRAPFTKDWYALATPAPLLQEGTMFVMLSDEATAYVIPYLLASDSFIRIEGNMPLDPGVGLGKVALTRIGAHQGTIRTLAPADYPLEQSKQRLASFGLAAHEDDCLSIATKVGKLRSCRLARLDHDG